MAVSKYVIPFTELGMNDVAVVGGKNASLGEMIQNLAKLGVKVPAGFATTADAFREFLSQGGLDNKINQMLKQLDVDDVTALRQTGEQIRKWIIDSPFQPELEDSIKREYEQLSHGSQDGACTVAVRSSATAEDLPEASFAGQQETFLNIHGIENVLKAMKHVFASLFNDRAISYRVHQGFDHHEVALSAGIQKMVRSDLASSGVMFTIDTESGFDQVVFITAAYGLGEMVVQGAVNPDEFYVHKPTLLANRSAIIRKTIGSKHHKMVYTDNTNDTRVKEVAVPEYEQNQFSLTDEEAMELARLAVIIENHYGRPMDIEWGKDGETGELCILQARPETVKSRKSQVMERYHLHKRGNIIVEGRSIGQKIGAGIAKVINSLADMDSVKPGDVLVTDMTDPD